MNELLRDLRYALRTLRRSPAVTAVAVLSLALGIGANTAIFSLIESTLLRPIPVKNLDRLRLMTWREQDGGWVAPNLGYLSSSFGSIFEQGVVDGGILHTEFSPAVYREFSTRSTVLESLFAFKELGRSTAVVDGNAEPVNCFLVSGGFYRGLDVTPVIGLPITPETDVRTEAGQVAVISYEYWTRRFSRSPSVLGKTIVVGEVPFTIIGVNPEYFTGIEPGAHFEIFAPLNQAAQLSGRTWLDDPRQWQIPMIGRLKPGVTDARAQQELNALFQAHVDADPGGLAGMLKDPAKRPRFILQSAARGVDYLAQRYDRMMLALFALAGLVLLIACANVANLLLVKSAARQREIGLRLALGAGRGRIVRQLITEGLLLASMAGIAGVVAGYLVRNGIPALLTAAWRPNLFNTAFDPKVLMMALSVTLASAVLFTLAPALQSRRVDLNEALKDTRSTAVASKLRIGRFLVVLQVALSLLLLAGAGFCVRTFTNLRDTPLGFKPQGLMLFTLDLPRLRYPAARIAPFLTDLQQRLESIPGIQAASFSRNTQYSSVGEGFFETMGIPILAGRAFERQDRPSDPPAAVVNQTYARRTFHDDNPVGQIYTEFNHNAYRIVGESADWHLDNLRSPIQPTVYTLMTGVSAVDNDAVHGATSPVTFEVRIAGRQADVERQIRKAVTEADSTLAVLDLRTAAQQIETGMAQERLMASLAMVFGGLALLLATIGIYGVMAYAVERRTSEIGIRAALGAQAGRLIWMILRETLALAAAGLAIGIPLVLALGPAADHFLAPAWQRSFAYGISPNDPRLVLAAALVLVAAGAAAAFFPARRAARIDPAVTLRHE